jgi:Glycosyl transferase family 2
MPIASIIINNFNYADFLSTAIESALSQSITDIEVIVVDDGSTDSSRAVIGRFGDRIRSVFKSNGGQASALNAGFLKSRGDIIVYLDADDVLRPKAISSAAAMLRSPTVSKVHWPMEVIDQAGALLGRRHPRSPLPDGDFRQEIVTQGPWMCEVPPTSANAWPRWAMQQIMPIPESQFRICADAYLLAASPLLGELRRIPTPLSCYRIHDRNNYWNRPFDQQLCRSIQTYECQCAGLSELMTARGIAHDSSNWIQHSWWHRVERAVNQIIEAVPPGDAFALADEDEWGTPGSLQGRKRLAFPQENSLYSGPPATDEHAVSQLNQLQGRGVRYFALAWNTTWYLEHFTRFAQELYQHRVLVESDAVRIFSLTQPA